jgi:NADH-quinone oxidoreductase subunit G
MVVLKDLMSKLGSPHLDCRQDGAYLEATPRSAYLFNTTISGIEAADACLLIGTNPRTEAPIINARIRKRYQTGDLKVGLVGVEADLTYRYDHLGNDAALLESIAAGKHPFAEVLKTANNPMLILGMGALARNDGKVILGSARKIANNFGLIDENAGWNGFNVLHTAGARVGGMDVGFLPGESGRDLAGILEGAQSGEIEVLYLLGADEIDTQCLGQAFVIYQGHHGDAGAHRADVILPGAAYTEKNATYVNTEGRVQRASLACHPPGEAKEDWTIIRALSAALGQTIAMDTLTDVRARLEEVNSSFAVMDLIKSSPWGDFGGSGKTDSTPFQAIINKFYLTNPICRASQTMAQCVEAIAANETRKTGTHG